MMKVESWIVAICLFVGSSSFARELVSVAPVEIQQDTEVVDSVYGLEALFLENQYQYLPVAPPSEEVFFQSLGKIVPVDWKGFPDEFRKGMYAEMSKGFSLYRISVYEDSVSRETVFLNSYGREVYRLAPEKGYDPYAWQKMTFGEKSLQTLDELSRWIYDPAHIAVDLVLIPEVFYTAYSEQAAEDAQAAPTAMPLMMAMGAGISKPMAHMTQGTNGVDLEISLPVGFGCYMEIFRRTDLMTASWAIEDSWIPTFENTNVVWTDTSEINKCFYHISNAVDSDGDGYSNLREAWFEGTDSNSFDTVNDDGDSMHDWWEIKMFGHTNQTDITDFDQDGLTDTWEMNYRPGTPPKIDLRCDPTLYDTDADELNDYDEVNGTPPTDPWDPDTSVPTLTVSPASGTVITP